LAYLEISTSGCFKKCPVIDIKLIDNIIYFNFIDFNDYVGFYSYKLTRNDIAKLNRLIESIDLEDLKSEYTSNIPDIQYYNTKFSYNGMEKFVFYSENQVLKGYSDLINYIIDVDAREIVKNDIRFNLSTRKRLPLEKIKMPLPPEG